MTPEQTQELIYFRWLEEQHRAYVEEHLRKFSTLHDVLHRAIADRIEDLEKSPSPAPPFRSTQ